MQEPHKSSYNSVKQQERHEASAPAALALLARRAAGDAPQQTHPNPVLAHPLEKMKEIPVQGNARCGSMQEAPPSSSTLPP